jgi:hypothetical protein
MSAARVAFLMEKLRGKWEAFMLGEVDKPP